MSYRVLKRLLGEVGVMESIMAQETTESAWNKLANWLSYHTELGYRPEDYELLDHRTLFWPPKGETIPVWLFRFRTSDPCEILDEWDVGMVGGITVSLFLEQHDRRPPEDVYARHCQWEMTHQDIAEVKKIEEGYTLADHRLARCPSDIEIDHQNNYLLCIPVATSDDIDLLSVSIGQRGDERGHVVIDESESFWYPLHDLPYTPGYEDEPNPRLTLTINAGRRLLGFTEPPDRSRWLRRDDPLAFEERRIRSFQRANEDPEFADQWMNKFNRVHFGHWLSNTRRLHPALESTECLILCYDTLLDFALTLPSTQPDPVQTIRPLEDRFEEYAEALIKLGRHDELRRRLDQLTPRWNGVWARSVMGHMASRIGEMERAESLLSQLLQLEGWENYFGIDHLARLYAATNRRDRAEQILTDAIRRIADKETNEDGTFSESDAHCLNLRVQTYFEIFPDRDVESLIAMGISVEFVPDDSTET